MQFKKYFFRSLLFILLAAAAIAVFIFLSKRFGRNENSERKVTPQEMQANEEELKEEQNSELRFRSESYQSPEIDFGGGLGYYFAGSGVASGNMEITDIKGELMMSKGKKDIDLLLVWKTGRPTRSEVTYQKLGGQENAMSAENYSADHSMVLRSLDPETTYSYVIKATDRSGGEARSEKFVFYTGAPDISFLDLLGGAFRNVFGWAMKSTE